MDITHPQVFLNSHRFYSLNRVLPLLVCHCYPEILNPISSTSFDNMNNSFQSTQLYSERCNELCGFANFRILISDPFLLLTVEDWEWHTMCSPLKMSTMLVVMNSSWQRLLAVQKIARGSWWLVCCESPGDPEATVAVSCWPVDRRKGYKQMVTGVRSRYFHFQNGRHSTRTLLAAYPITVGETRARWQALASPGEE